MDCETYKDGIVDVADFVYVDEACKNLDDIIIEVANIDDDVSMLLTDPV